MDGLTYQSAPRKEALAQDCLTTYGPEHSAFIVRRALVAAKAADFAMQTFGGTKNFLPQALAAWERRAETERAKREARTRIDEQFRRECEERDERRRLSEIRSSLPASTLEALRRRAEEALTATGVARTHLGYNMLVKMKMDDLLEREYLADSMCANRHAPDGVAAPAGTR